MKSLFTIAAITTLTLLSFTMPARGQPPVSGLPAGVIVMWSGSLDAIPAGWALCDGSDGTPDLSNRFVLGVGAAEYQGSTGGSHSHKHRTREHIHQIDPPSMRLRSAYGYSGYGSGGGTRGRSYMFPGQVFDMRPFKSAPTRATADSGSHLPPDYKIACFRVQ